MAETLISVISQKDVEVKDLKPFKARDFKKFYSGKSAIHYACNPHFNVTNRFDVIKYLVKVRKVNVNKTTDDGYYPLQILFWGIDQRKMVDIEKEVLDELKLIVLVFKKAGANFHVERYGVTPFMLCCKYFKEIRLLKRIGFPTFKLIEEDYPEERLLKYTNPITYFYVYSMLQGVMIKTQLSFERIIRKIKDLQGMKSPIFEKLKREKDVLEEEVIIITRRIAVQSRLKEIRLDDFPDEVFWGVPTKKKVELQEELPHQYVREYEVMEFGETQKSKLDEDEPRVSYRDFRKQQLKENPNIEFTENKDSIWTGKLITKVEKLNTVYFMFMFIKDIKDLGYFWNQFIESFKGDIENIQKAVMDDNKEEFQTTCLHLLFSKRFMNSEPDDLNIIDIITEYVKCKGDEHKNANSVSPAMLYVQNYKPIDDNVNLYEKIIIEKKKPFPKEELTKIEKEVKKMVLEIAEKYVPIVTETLSGIRDESGLVDSQENTLLHYAGFGRNLLMYFILLKAFDLKRKKNKVFMPEIEEEGKVNFGPHYTLELE